LLLGIGPLRAVAQEEAPEVAPQDRPKPKTHDKGPRALALLEIASSGRGTVFPIAILVDGKWYDASAYKASPTPLALEPGTIYEGMRAGNPQGLLTIASVLHSDAAGAKYSWLAKGAWLAEGATVASTGHKAETAPLGLEGKDDPPRLSKAPPANVPSAAPKSSTNIPPGPANHDKATPKNPAASAAPNDDSPVKLRRGKPVQPLPEDKNEPHGVLQTVLAISDADVRDPVSFRYDWDKTEREARQKQIEAMAQEAVHTFLQSRASGSPPKKPSSKIAITKADARPEPLLLDHVSLVAADVWRGNQPVLIYTAEADVPPNHGVNQHPEDSSASQCFVTVVARSDIYGNLKQLFASVTDRLHLDVAPRLEFIDAVDADADGRGELVFRETTDSASGFLIYKPGGDSLFKMYDSLNLQ